MARVSWHWIETLARNSRSNVVIFWSRLAQAKNISWTFAFREELFVWTMLKRSILAAAVQPFH
jgi:hypothetical protein